MRTFISSIESRFDEIHKRSKQVLWAVSGEALYLRPRELPQTYAMFSVGEYLLRSAAAIEQTFGGITTRLWDDPFEWTLPEKLSTAALVAEYLDEADASRQRGMAFLTSDDDLRKQIPAPAEIKTIFEVLLEAIARAEHFQGRAFAVFQMLSDEKLPRV